MNIMTEFMGLIYGDTTPSPSASPRRHVAAQLHAAARPDKIAYDNATKGELKPVKLHEHAGLHVRDALSHISRNLPRS